MPVSVTMFIVFVLVTIFMQMVLFVLTIRGFVVTCFVKMTMASVTTLRPSATDGRPWTGLGASVTNVVCSFDDRISKFAWMYEQVRFDSRRILVFGEIASIGGPRCIGSVCTLQSVLCSRPVAWKQRTPLVTRGFRHGTVDS